MFDKRCFTDPTRGCEVGATHPWQGHQNDLTPKAFGHPYGRRSIASSRGDKYQDSRSGAIGASTSRRSINGAWRKVRRKPKSTTPSARS